MTAKRRILQFVLPLLSLPLSGALAQSPIGMELYIRCSFYPEAGVCEPVYRAAIANSDLPAADSARREYEAYARYLDPRATLTPEDMEYLGANSVTLPDYLTQAEKGGLHNLLADPKFAQDAEAKLPAIANFLSRALAAQGYCMAHECDKARRADGN